MAKYIIRKLSIMFLTVLMISFAVFFIITLPPGDFLTNYVGRMVAAGETVDQAMIDKLRDTYGLDQPFVVQYWRWISGILFHGDFGYSFSLSMPAFWENLIRSFSSLISSDSRLAIMPTS